MYKNILVAVDADEPASWADALPVAVELARCFSARLTLCSVVRDVEAEVEAEWSSIGYREMLDLTKVRLAELAAGIDGVAIDVAVGTGTIRGGIIETARRIAADLVVLASHVPAMKDRVWAGNAARVARRADCSVLIVRNCRAEGQEGEEGDVR